MTYQLMKPAFVEQNLTPAERRQWEREAERNLKAFEERERQKERAHRIAARVGTLMLGVVIVITLAWYVHATSENFQNYKDSLPEHCAAEVC